MESPLDSAKAELTTQKDLIRNAVALLRERPGGKNCRSGVHAAMFRYDDLVANLCRILDPNEHCVRVPLPSDLITLDEAALVWGRGRGAISHQISRKRLRTYNIKGVSGVRVSYAELVKIRSLRYYKKLTEAGGRLAREMAKRSGNSRKTREKMLEEIHERCTPQVASQKNSLTGPENWFTHY